MLYKQQMVKSIKEIWPWAIFLLASSILGAYFNNQLAHVLADFLKTSLSLTDNPAAKKVLAVPIAMVLFYLLKNGSVALLCVVTGWPTRGIIPASIVVVNGVMIGLVSGLLQQNNILQMWQFGLCLAPHGIFEVFAILLACAIGIQKIDLKSKMKLFKIPVALLVVAAFMEAYVSPMVVDGFL
jgi:uncharacterized membrane protein SpoIIM required for sporulation